MRPEKTSGSAVGRGFDSPHLHNHHPTPPPACKGSRGDFYVSDVLWSDAE